MVDYLDIWQQERAALRSPELPSSLEIIGRFKGALGAHLEPASVRFAVASAECFEVVDLAPFDTDLQSAKYPDYFILGLLDVLMAENPDLPNRIRITLQAVDCDKVMVAPLCFRIAGREGGLNLLYHLKPETRILSK